MRLRGGRLRLQLTVKLRDAANALLLWFRGATGAQQYESYLRHAEKQAGPPLSEKEFYLDDVRRKYSRPNRCC